MPSAILRSGVRAQYYHSDAHVIAPSPLLGGETALLDVSARIGRHRVKLLAAAPPGKSTGKALRRIGSP